MTERDFVEQMKAELKAKSDADPLGFRKAAAWDAVMDAEELRPVRQRLSLDNLKYLIDAIVPAASYAHDWFTYGRLNWECCRVCGVVRRMDGKNNPCRGQVRVGPRDEP